MVNKLLSIEELRFEIRRLEARPFNAKAKWAMRLFEMRKDLEQREYSQRGDGVIVTSEPLPEESPVIDKAEPG